MNVLDLVYSLAAVVAAPWWMRKTRGDWRGRLGHTEPLAPTTAAGPRRVLLHAVSVGEVNAIRGLVPRLIERGLEVVVSVGTDTGVARARELFERGGAGAAAGRVHVVRYPLDFSRSVRRFLDAVRPDIAAMVELELWPNFVRACGRRGIPVCVINGRLSERSFRGYKRVRWFMRRTFASLTRAGVQDDTYRQRFIAMGVPPERCAVTGSMKWDAAAVTDDVPGAESLARELGIDRSKPLIVAGSTGPLPNDDAGEEGLLHAACPQGAQLLCAPRRPERFDEAHKALGGDGACVRRSRGPVTSSIAGRARFLLDTIGELRAAYALADVVVVGRSFGDLYGSDPIEPISLGKATVIGPAIKDFESIVASFDSEHGIVRTTAADLGRTLQELLADPGRRHQIAERGRACIRANQGATQRHVELIESVLATKRQ